MQFIPLVLTVLCAATLTQPVYAHHSQGMYDISTWTMLEGTIRRVRWTNPHAWVFVDVEDEQGQVQTWALEGGSPNAVSAPRSLTGLRGRDPVSMRGIRERDGRR